MRIIKWYQIQQGKKMKKPKTKVFDPKNETVLFADDRGLAVSAILSPDGHPVIYLSRKLTSPDANYSNIETEALSIVWSTE